VKFTLTIFDYACFWFTSGYAEKHGKTKECLSVDRKDPALGYEFSNIRALTVSENSRCRFVPYFRDQETREIEMSETEQKIREAYPEFATD